MPTKEVKRPNTLAEEYLSPNVKKVIDKVFSFVSFMPQEAIQKVTDIYTMPPKVTGDPGWDIALDTFAQMLPGMSLAIQPGEALRQLSRIPGWRTYLLQNPKKLQALKRGLRGADKKLLDQISSVSEFSPLEKMAHPTTAGALYTAPAPLRKRKAYDVILRNIEEFKTLEKNPEIGAMHELVGHPEELAIKGSERTRLFSEAEDVKDIFNFNKIMNRLKKIETKWNQPLTKKSEQYAESRAREIFEGITEETDFIRNLHPEMANKLDLAQQLSREKNAAYEAIKRIARGKSLAGSLPSYVEPMDITIAQKMGAKSNADILDFVAQDRIKNPLVTGQREKAMEWAKRIYADVPDATKQKILNWLAIKPETFRGF